MKRTFLIVALLGALVASSALVAACGNSDGFRRDDSAIDLDPSTKLPKDLAEVKDPAPRDPNKPLPEQKNVTGVSTDLKVKPTVPKPTGDAPEELQGTDVVTGTGDPAKSGDSVSVRYVGVLFKTGKEFDSSWSRGKAPFTFTLGQHQVITGWDDGVTGMKVGGRRILVIPADQAYGPTGQPPTIPADSPLVFVVDMVKIEPPKAGAATTTTP